MTEEILTKQYFYDITLLCNNDALLPRSETEILCEYALDLIQDNSITTLADLGTGSGAIAITLALKNKNLKIDAFEKSNPAFTIAKNNIELNKVANINLINKTWQSINKSYDLLIANPPYVTTASTSYLLTNKILKDPQLALDGGVTGLECIDEILSIANTHLNKQGHLLIEHGLGQHGCIRKLLANYPNLKYLNYCRDLQHIKRIIHIQHN